MRLMIGGKLKSRFLLIKDGKEVVAMVASEAVVLTAVVEVVAVLAVEVEVDSPKLTKLITGLQGKDKLRFGHRHLGPVTVIQGVSLTVGLEE